MGDAGSSLRLVPHVALGTIEVHGPDGLEGTLPAWLVERPDVLRELVRIAEAGGAAELHRLEAAPDVVEVLVRSHERYALAAALRKVREGGEG